ncbi:MAG: ribosome maturation factor RimP [Bdellovibrionales bacterium]|nr:ribosome maturation factor RimP [Bdellovibrionales bacterium]
MLRAGAPAFYFVERFVISIQKSPLENRLLDFCDKLIGPHGFRTVDIDCALARRSLLRVFIDLKQPHSEGATENHGVTLQDCQRVSELLGPALEVEDFFSGPYDLEVSSPGLERRLRIKPDFESCIGSEVKLRLSSPVKSLGRNVRAHLRGVSEVGVELESQGKEVTIPWDQIRRGNLVWNFD